MLDIRKKTALAAPTVPPSTVGAEGVGAAARMIRDYVVLLSWLCIVNGKEGEYTSFFSPPLSSVHNYVSGRFYLSRVPGYFWHISDIHYDPNYSIQGNGDGSEYTRRNCFLAFSFYNRSVRWLRCTRECVYICVCDENVLE